MAAPAQAATAQSPASAKIAGPPAKLAPSQPPAAKPVQAAGARVDGGWPRAYETESGGRAIVYQPQVASWENQLHMTAYAAVAYEAKGATKPALGSLKIEADTSIAVDSRLVSFKDLKITESNFPTLPREHVREVVAEIQKSIPDKERVIALDRVLASLDRSQIMPKNVDGVKADPPVIFYSAKPAVLVNVDGEAIWSPIANNDLKFAVNTNWDLFQHVPTQTLYLRNETAWLKAATLDGPWTPAGKLPESFAKLPADENWKEVKAALPGRSLTAEGRADGLRQHDSRRS